MSYKEDFFELCGSFGCDYREKEPLSAHTTFKIGGEAGAVVMVNSEESLCALLKYLNENDIKHFILGKGSNILAADSGFDGVILKLASDYAGIELIDGNRIRCDAGISLMEVCRFALDHSLSGMEFAYGIPGTAGGGLYMNAGAYGGEMKDVIGSARYCDKKGEIHEISAADMDLSYRHSVFCDNRDMIITSLVLALKPGSRDEIKAKMDELMGRRRDKQPLEYPSAGSTFKRPQGSYASLLIEQCGLKGMTVGGAQVSEKHSGFVINKGGATFDDVMRLCEKVRDIVLEKTGYSLELEPIILK